MQKGKLALQKRPKVLVRLTGSAPVQAKVWTYDWLRCNSCGAIFTAPLPAAAGPPEKFDESVTSTIGLLRYGFGMPFNRLENLQLLCGNCHSQTDNWGGRGTRRGTRSKLRRRGEH